MQANVLASKTGKVAKRGATPKKRVKSTKTESAGRNKIELPTTLDELQKEITRLEKKFGFAKINIRHGDDGNEGIWVVLADEASARQYKDNKSSGQIIYCRFTNQPLLQGWYWGSLVKATTRGNDRPEAIITRDEEILKQDQLNLAVLFLDDYRQRINKLQNTLIPFARFAEKFRNKPIKGLSDEMYGIHQGTPHEAVLRLSDCKAALKLIEGDA